MIGSNNGSIVKFVNKEVYDCNLHSTQNYEFCRFSARQWSRADQDAQLEAFEKTHQFLTQNDHPLAVIMTAAHDYNGAFHENKNYFSRDCNQLLRNKYTILQIDDIEDPKEIEPIVQSIAKKIHFFDLRGHGKPQNIQFGKEKYLYSQEVSQVFSWLPSKLDDHAVIYLESCSTGKIEDDFQNNILFSFGKLTRNMPNVLVAAPSKDAWLQNFTLNERTFNFYANVSVEEDSNMMKVIDKKTKEILNAPEAIESEKLLSSLNNHLSSTILGCSTLKILNEAKVYPEEALFEAIVRDDSRSAESLLSSFEINPNVDTKNSSFVRKRPILAAFYKGSLESVKILLKYGADLFQEVDNCTPIRFLLDLKKTAQLERQRRTFEICTALLQECRDHCKQLDTLNQNTNFSEKLENEIKNFEETLPEFISTEGIYDRNFVIYPNKDRLQEWVKTPHKDEDEDLW